MRQDLLETISHFNIYGFSWKDSGFFDGSEETLSWLSGKMSEFQDALSKAIDHVAQLIDHDDPLISTSIITFLVMAGLVFALNLFIVLARLKTSADERRKDRLFELWSQIFFEVLYKGVPGHTLIKMVKKRDLESFSDFLGSYLDVLKGRDWGKVAQIYRDAGLVDLELHHLENTNHKWRRSLAAYRLGQVKAQESLPLLMHCVRETESVLVYSAATAIMAIGDATYIKHTLTILLNHEGLSEELFSEIILGYGKSLNMELMEMMKLYTKLPRSRLRIIDFLGYFRNLMAVPVLIELLKTSWHTEEKIRLVKALGILTTPESMPALQKCLKDENGTIRAQAAKALGHFEEEENIPLLAPLLEDRDWWCRNHAATAILKSGPKGKPYLQMRMKWSKDPYAVDMITQVLEKE